MRGRRIYQLVVLGCLMIMSSHVASSAQIAITEGGRTVILKDDGTWLYVKEKREQQKVYTFRKTKWGMTNQEVQKSEEEATFVKNSGDTLIYEGTVAGLYSYIAYNFIKGKLVWTKCLITERHSNKNDYIGDYDRIKKMLTKKYGKPSKDEHYWRDDLYRNDFEHLGFAISLGHLVYYATWQTSETDVYLGLTGDNGQVELAVEYQSRSLKELSRKSD